MEIATAIIQYASWPIAVLILLLVFRKPISSLIERTEEFSVGSMRAGVRQSAARTSPDPLAPVDNPAYTPRSLPQEVQMLMENLPRLGIEVDQLDPRSSRLVNLIGRSLLQNQFLWIHSLIYGTQIEALRWMIQHDDRPISKADVEPFYKEHLKIAKPLEVILPKNIDEYLSFLAQQGLISAIGDLINLTDKGRDYLDFAINAPARGL